MAFWRYSGARLDNLSTSTDKALLGIGGALLGTGLALLGTELALLGAELALLGTVLTLGETPDTDTEDGTDEAGRGRDLTGGI